MRVFSVLLCVVAASARMSVQENRRADRATKKRFTMKCRRMPGGCGGKMATRLWRAVQQNDDRHGPPPLPPPPRPTPRHLGFEGVEAVLSKAAALAAPKLTLSAGEPHHSTTKNGRSHIESLKRTHSPFPSLPPEECQQPHAAVPNILHRVWLGACPGLKELVSLLAASLLLSPDEIVYHILANAPNECLVKRPAPLPPLNLSACWEGLNVSFNRINVSDSKQPLVQAMGASQKQLLSRKGGSSNVARVALIDFIRVWALHTRGL